MIDNPYASPDGTVRSKSASALRVVAALLCWTGALCFLSLGAGFLRQFFAPVTDIASAAPLLIAWAAVNTLTCGLMGCGMLWENRNILLVGLLGFFLSTAGLIGLAFWLGVVY